MNLADAIRNALTGVPVPEDRPPLPDARGIRPPRYPDALVFGPSPGPDPLRRLEFTGYTRSCGCGVRWLGDAVRCWCCGRPT